MASAIPPNPAGSREARQGNRGHGVEKGPVEARQGFRGRPVLYILAVSLVLAVVAYLVLHFYFAASFTGPSS